MIADIEAGLVKRVIIKDMSRLGRDYLQVGMYTEIMFPEHDIHFIAVNDGVDSTQGDNEFTPFRNIINEWYAKDTSKKIRAVMKVKGNAGEHLTTLPPYGYMKAPDNKKLWVRDEEAAAVVYEIGLYVMDGFGPSQIARKLTERRILTPAAYYASKGWKASNIKRGLPYAWDASTVADIMDRWREYLGHTVNFKTRKKSYKSKKVIHNPESEWMIFENTHDPIWTEAIADAARAARQTRRRPTKMGEMGMFSGMMFCADCGSVMYQCRATSFRREQEYYLCAGYRKSRDFCGQTHSIRTVILEELILENLREIVSFASRSKDEFVRLVMDNDLRQRDRNIAKRKRQLADSEKRITELDAIFKRLYEDSISGKLSDERFQKLSADYEKEEQELKVLASSLRKEVELEESKSADVDRFLSVVERYTDIPELTPCILHEFVEKIIVHAAATRRARTGRRRSTFTTRASEPWKCQKSRHQWKNEKTVQPKLYRSLFPHDVFLSGAAFRQPLCLQGFYQSVDHGLQVLGDSDGGSGGGLHLLDGELGVDLGHDQAVLGDFQHAHLGDDLVDAVGSGQGQAALLEDLGVALGGVLHADDALAGADAQVHSAAHAGHLLAGDDPVGQVALGIHFQSAQEAGIHVTAADQAEVGGGVDEAAAESHGGGRTTGIHHVVRIVIVVAFLGGLAGGDDTQLSVDDQLHVLGQIVGDQGGQADAQVHDVAVLQLFGAALGDKAFDLALFHYFLSPSTM